MVRRSDQRHQAPGANRYQVFVSHATNDKFLARVICEKLERAGAVTFRDDRDINGGDNIPDAVRREIQRSKELLVLLTPYSYNRPWVLLEVGAAWGWRKDYRITPVLCHIDTDTIPEMLSQKRAIDLNDFEAYLDQVARRAKKAGGRSKKVR